jgi:N-acyl-L-homoserine lactone synthetase
MRAMNKHRRSRKAIITTLGLRPSVKEEFGAFRKALFVDRLGWSLKLQGNIEIDEFDTDNAVYCLMLESDKIIAGFRAVITTIPYLVKTHFSHLGATRPFPSRDDYYEISRFGVLSADNRLDIGLMTYALMFDFAQRRDATALIAIADLGHERLLRAMGIRTRRYGPPGVVGVDAWGQPIVSVAGDIPIAEQSPELIRLLSNLCETELEITDETHVLGRASVYA